LFESWGLKKPSQKGGVKGAGEFCSLGVGGKWGSQGPFLQVEGLIAVEEEKKSTGGPCGHTPGGKTVRQPGISSFHFEPLKRRQGRGV